MWQCGAGWFLETMIQELIDCGYFSETEYRKPNLIPQSWFGWAL